MDTLEAIRQRRAINFFDPQRDIADETLRELVETASLAPSSYNLQPWHVIAVRTPEGKRALRACAYGQPKVEEASVTLIIMADLEVIENNIEKVLAPKVASGEITQKDVKATREQLIKGYGKPLSRERLLLAAKNTGLFAMNLMIAAKGMGLETHPMDGFRADAVREEFHIPAHMEIPMLIAVGYLRPAVELNPRAYRRPLADYLHRDSF